MRDQAERSGMRDQAERSGREIRQERSGMTDHAHNRQMSGNTTLSVLFYVQHLLGIGHLVRAHRITSALRDYGFTVTLVTGGMPLAGFDTAGIEHVQLPAIGLSGEDFQTLVDRQGVPIDDKFRDDRRDVLLDTYHCVHPDVVLLEAFPFGRRQVRFELLPLIETIANSSNRPLLVASIRDILQRRTKPGRDETTADLINAHFDNVLVHGDPQFMPLEASFSHAVDIATRVQYTGLVCGPTPELDAQSFDVVVSAGGGAVGEKLVSLAIKASQQLPHTVTWCIITGPNLAEHTFSTLKHDVPTNVSLVRFRKDFVSVLAQTKVSVSQAGYNTFSDLMQSECQCVLVPFSAGGETEQTDRAYRLQELGMATVLPEDSLSAEQLAKAVDDSLSSKAASSRVSINTNGAWMTARLLHDLYDKRGEIACDS